MKKLRFTESQIVAILGEAEAGTNDKEVCREHKVFDATCYNWKAKCRGMSVSELKRTKALDAENAKLKRMYDDLALENRAMKDLIEKGSDAAGEA
ncbi:MAG: transposase [Anaerolineaceae bacterium]|nr:MAG: transposase [Anaerolineaceae bacterium]